MYAACATVKPKELIWEEDVVDMEPKARERGSRISSVQDVMANGHEWRLLKENVLAEEDQTLFLCSQHKATIISVIVIQLRIRANNYK